MSSTRRNATGRCAALVCAVAAACLGACGKEASAARDLEVSIMDDQLLLKGSDRKLARQMQIFRALGVDRVRVSAFWRDHAPASGSRRKPRGFDAGNPGDPAYNWATLDRVVGHAAAGGIKVMLSITTPAPSWAAGSALGRPGLSRPRPREFGLFARAVAGRYGSVVDHYGISNEPNQPGWLMPQSDRRGPVAPHHYRNMVRAAYPRIKSTDPSSVVLIGELASSGRVGRGSGRAIRPLAFLRAMACLDRRYRPVRRGRCRGFRPVPADAVGHHPYSLLTNPSRPSPKRDDASIGDGRRLLRVLDRLTGRGAVRKAGGGRLSVFYTEFGYQTNPPDPFAGIPLRRHNRYLQLASYIAWRTPRVRGINQFRLTDGVVYREPGPAAYREFQSGLLFANRRKKPAFVGFPHPFVIAGSRFWGQVRPGGAHRVTIQERAAGRRWRTIRRLRTDARGYFSTRARRRRGRYYRFLYDGAPAGKSNTLRIG